MIGHAHLAEHRVAAEDPAERRSQRRYDLALPLHLQTRVRRRSTQEWDRPERTITKNISSRGCYFYLVRKPQVGAHVRMEIAMPSVLHPARDGKILCYGRVVRVEDREGPSKIGVACKIESYEFVLSKAHTHRQ